MKLSPILLSAMIACNAYSKEPSLTDMIFNHVEADGNCETYGTTKICKATVSGLPTDIRDSKIEFMTKRKPATKELYLAFPLSYKVVAHSTSGTFDDIPESYARFGNLSRTRRYLLRKRKQKLFSNNSSMGRNLYKKVKNLIISLD